MVDMLERFVSVCVRHVRGVGWGGGLHWGLKPLSFFKIIQKCPLSQIAMILGSIKQHAFELKLA